MSGIMVLVEHRQGALRDVTFEMLAAARGLAGQTGDTVEAVLLGDGCEALLPALQEQAGRVTYVAGSAFREFNYEVYQQALVRLCADERPELLLVAHSASGADLAPSLAVALGRPLVSDAIALRSDRGGYVITRGMYSGKLNADWQVAPPALVMVRQSSFRPEPAGLAGELVRWDPGPLPAARTRFIGLEEVPTTGIDITRAEVVIGVGRGAREAKNLAPIREFAESIGAALAGSRPVIDAGWLPKEVQVGSSGKTVKPRVYIALGISGAFQHVAGMKAADTIIAVNKDPNAPIFAVAHYGIVDDLHKVVPLLSARLKEARA